MKKILLSLLLILPFICTAQTSKIKQDIVKTEGQHKIKYNDDYFDVDTTAITVKFNNPNAINKNYNVIRSNKLGYFDIQVPANITVVEYATTLSQDANIETIDYNSFGEYCDEYIPDDPLLNKQWYLVAINMYNAWNIHTGNSDIIVGVLDSGTYWKHPDLGLGTDSYQNIYLNPGEDSWIDPDDPATGNGIDDDNNGLIDDWKGWNFVDDSNDVRTSNRHGTMVAGIVGAKTNNAYGISGVAGGNNGRGVQLLCYCIGIDSVFTQIIDDALIAAVDNGVRIIQLSISVQNSEAIDAAIQYAADNNVIVVCGSGNSGSSTVKYPASHPYVIAVGGSDINNKKWQNQVMEPIWIL